jgi:hypothetical protein
VGATFVPDNIDIDVSYKWQESDFVAHDNATCAEGYADFSAIAEIMALRKLKR